MVDVDRELALAQLEALVKIPGALKVITAEHACGIPAVRGQAMPTDAEDIETCNAFTMEVVEQNLITDEDGNEVTEETITDRPIGLNDPRHFVQHNVAKLEEVNAGRWRATTEEGDWTEGQPMALLNRLQQWRSI